MNARERMIADRRLRDSAKALLTADLEFLKSDLARKGLTERAVDRFKSGAIDVYDEAMDVASDHKGALAALLAALAVWAARHPLAQRLGLGREDEPEQGDGSDR